MPIPTTRMLSRWLSAAAAAGLLAGCAAERTAADAPAGVNLTGEWQLNPGLSDDPDKLQDTDQATHTANSSSGRRHRDRQAPAAGHSASAPAVAHSLAQPPQHIAIAQRGRMITISTRRPDEAVVTDELTAGSSGTIAYGAGSALRSVGWRGPALVIDTKPASGREQEDDYALDDTGQLILTTRAGKIELRRVYDRITAAGSGGGPE